MRFFKALLVLILCLLLISGAFIAYFWHNRVVLTEKALNTSAHELFEGSLRLKSMEITKDLRVILTGLKGRMKTDTGSVPIQIEKIEGLTPLTDTIKQRRSELAFKDFATIPLTGNPVSGNIQVDFNAATPITIQSAFSHVAIEDYGWIDPPSFEGLRGFVDGQIRLKLDNQERLEFSIELKSEPLGGEVPSKFLEFALPYLPKAQNTKNLKQLIDDKKTVRFVNGSIRSELTEPGKIQTSIAMRFPEPNINLNLNLTILVDEEHAFIRAFKLLGLFKIKAGSK